MTTKELEQKALNLKPIDKLHLVEQILESLDHPDSQIEKAWVAESESRYTDYKNNTIAPVDFNSLKKNLKKWK